MADTEIVVLAEAGEWVKCVVHRGAAHADALAQGWCLRHDAVQVFVVEDSNAYPARQRLDPHAEEEELIYELRDEDNRVYYFNSYTGLSMWEPPEWVDELDPHSGACYYTHSKTGETQWERPFDFVPIVREELYSTPQAAFLKSILSPKRSHHRMPQTTGPR